MMVDFFNDGLLDVCQEWGLNQGCWYLVRVSEGEEFRNGGWWSLMRKVKKKKREKMLWLGIELGSFGLGYKNKDFVEYMAKLSAGYQFRAN